MGDGGYERVPEEDPDEENPTESEPRRTDESDWKPGRRHGSRRHQYETKKGGSTGYNNPSYEDDEETRPPQPPEGFESIRIFDEGGESMDILTREIEMAWDETREKYE